MGSSESQQDRYRRDTLEPQYNEFKSKVPNLFDYYNTERNTILANRRGFTPLSTDTTNRYFDVSSGNLNRTALGQAGQSAGQAGALAASRGLANPSGFTSGAYQSTLGQFAPQFGSLEANRAQTAADIARYNNQGVNQENRDLVSLLTQLAQMGGTAMQGDFSNQGAIMNAASGMAQYYDPYSPKEKNTQMLGGLIGGGAQAASSYYGSQRPDGSK